MSDMSNRKPGDDKPSMICGACGMLVHPANAYHPHLFCTLWREYHMDPALLLAEYGYVRKDES